jgi:hypothetical protein
MAKIEIIGASVRHAPIHRPLKCQLQFKPKIHTVRFVARKLSKICKLNVKIIAAHVPSAVLSASLLDRFPDSATFSRRLLVKHSREIIYAINQY